MAGLPEVGHGLDYDLIVIGGGSGGLAASKQAAELGQKVAVLDFVKPSPLGSTWGIGGTCVNVGCIPKKLMHKAGVHGEDMHAASRYGWTHENRKHNWETLVTQVQNYIKSLNYGYETQLKDKKVEYINAYGRYIDEHTIELDFGPGKEAEKRTVTCRRSVVAVGGRPNALQIPGGEHALSSDDLFMHAKNPGKVCVVGASYVALECAGFLTAIGCDVTVLVRSILLRGFDQEMAEKIRAHMITHGTKFVNKVNPQSIVKNADGKFTVTYGGKEGDPTVEEFDTVLQAIGRNALTGDIGLDKVGVNMNKKGEIIVDKEQTNVKDIYALGDCIEGIWELTPVAIQAGQLLAKRLYGKGSLYMDYHTIATTVFTPLEYGAIGFSEEDALEKFGKDNVEVYHTVSAPLEWSLPPPVDARTAANMKEFNEDKAACFAKLVCLKNEDERVVGLHYAGPNAGEITQGFSTAMRLGATKMDFDLTVGIHPTAAEVFTTLQVTKSSGADAEADGC
jgi:thioredoxin reductase (NADPH)